MLGTLIVSPLASHVRDRVARDRVCAAIGAAMRGRGVTRLDVQEASDPASIRAAAEAAVRDGTGLVVVAGGDGTVRDAVGPLVDTRIPVAIVPCGTGNLYATAVGVPRDIDAAIAAIRAGSPVARDVGAVRMTPPGRPGGGPLPGEVPLPGESTFVVACGTGLDARLVAATSRDAKRRYGVAAYFLAASRLLGDLAPSPTVIEVDGARRELASVVVLIANCGEAIPGRLAPRLPISPDDGLLHVFVLPRGGVVDGIRGAIGLMLADAAGESASGAGLRLLGRHVAVTVTPAGPVQVDGDVVGPASLEARVRPGGLLVLRP